MFRTNRLYLFKRPTDQSKCLSEYHGCRCFFTSSVIYIQSHVNGHLSRNLTNRVQRSTPWQNSGIQSFSPFLFSDLVVDLGDSTFTAPTLNQLVDRALAVTLEFVQVLVKDLTGTQSRYQIIKLPADLFRDSTLLGPSFPFPLLLQLEKGDMNQGKIAEERSVKEMSLISSHQYFSLLYIYSILYRRNILRPANWKNGLLLPTIMVYLQVWVKNVTG